MGKKKAQTFAIRSRAHHKPNILREVRAIIGTIPMYILLLVSCRGGDSRAIEQIKFVILQNHVCKITKNIRTAKRFGYFFVFEQKISWFCFLNIKPDGSSRFRRQSAFVRLQFRQCRADGVELRTCHFVDVVLGRLALDLITNCDEISAHSSAVFQNLCFPLFHNRRNRVAVALDADDEGLGRAESEEHIEAHGNVVLVVGDVEIDDALVFAVVEFHVRELQAAVFHAVVALDDRFSAIDDSCGFAAVAIDHPEIDGMAFFPVLGVEGACTDEHGEHVIDAVGIGFPLLAVCAVGPLAVLARVDFSVGIVVGHFVDVVAFAFAGGLAVVERREVECGIAQERVAQDEVGVNSFVALRDERGAPCRLPLMDALHG